MKSIFKILTLLLFSGSIAAQTPIFIHFDTDRAELSPASQEELKTAIAALNDKRQQYQVVITGHTDFRGNAAYNLDLSRRRSAVVADYMVANGWKPDQIKTTAEGENRPIETASTANGLAKNRRVEIRFERIGLSGWQDRNTVPKATLHFIAEKGFQFESPRSGTRVNIPPGILVTRNGTPVTGPVDLQFREYRGVADYLAAGIPMHYSDDRGDFLFNSGGMFEIRTFQNGEALFIAPGKSYEVSYAPTADLSGANLFWLDETTQQWDYLSSAAFNNSFAFGDGRPVETAQPIVVNEADVVRQNTAVQNTDENNCDMPFIAFPSGANKTAMLMQAIQVGHQISRGAEKIEPWFRKFPKRSDAFFLASLERSSIELIGNLSGKFFPDDKIGTFTELLAFKDHYFESDSSEMTKIGDFLKGPVDQKSNAHKPVTPFYKSFVVHYEGNGKCLITLNNGESEIAVHAELRMSTELAQRNKQNDADQVIEKYKKLREERQGAILARINQWRDFLHMAPVLMTNQEFCMGEQEWLLYFHNNLPTMRQRYEKAIAEGIGSDSTLAGAALKAYEKRRNAISARKQKRIALANAPKSGLYATLQIAQFGVFNCDQIFRLARNPELISATFKSAEGAPITPFGFSILDRETRIFIDTYIRGKMYKLPGKPLDIIITDETGRVFYLSGTDYAKIDFANQDEMIFTMQEVTDKVGSPKDWAQLLRI